MNPYLTLLERLGVGDAALRYARGDLPLAVEPTIPPRGYGFPPALIPLSSSPGPSYLGVWKHWFVDRPLSFVEVFVERGYRPTEIARTVEQFSIRLLIEQIMYEDEISDLVRQLASELGLPDLADIEGVVTDTGDDPEGLVALAAFRTKTPLECVPSGGEYDGYFLRADVAVPSDSLTAVCGLEVPATVTVPVAAPGWLAEGEPRPRFEQLLNAGDYGGAWLTLNSPGWSFRDARSSLRDLSEAAKDPDFSEMVEAWESYAHENVGGY